MQPGIGANPQPALGILAEGKDRVFARAVGVIRIGQSLLVSETVRIALAVAKVDKPCQRAVRRAPVQPTTVGTDPQKALGVFQERKDPIAAQSTLRPSASPEVAKSSGASVELVKSQARADPQEALGILCQGEDLVETQTAGIAFLRVVPAESARLSIQLVQSTSGANPQCACSIL